MNPSTVLGQIVNGGLMESPRGETNAGRVRAAGETRDQRLELNDAAESDFALPALRADDLRCSVKNILNFGHRSRF